MNFPNESYGLAFAHWLIIRCKHKAIPHVLESLQTNFYDHKGQIVLGLKHESINRLFHMLYQNDRNTLFHILEKVLIVPIPKSFSKIFSNRRKLLKDMLLYENEEFDWFIHFIRSCCLMIIIYIFILSTNIRENSSYILFAYDLDVKWRFVINNVDLISFVCSWCGIIRCFIWCPKCEYGVCGDESTWFNHLKFYRCKLQKRRGSEVSSRQRKINHIIKSGPWYVPWLDSCMVKIYGLENWNHVPQFFIIFSNSFKFLFQYILFCTITI